jgi:hypothetical protein
MVLIVEATNGNLIALNSDGVLIKDGANTNEIVLSSDGITITDASGNEIKTDDSGITCSDKNGNEIVMESASVTIKGSAIKIGDGASEPLVLGNQLNSALMQWINGTFATHMHTGNLGAPTTPPIPGAPLVLTPALSLTNTVK